MFRRSYIVISVFAIHTALVLLLFTAIVTSRDPEARMAWGIMFIIDSPVSRFLKPQSNMGCLAAFLIMGGLQWTSVSIPLQLLVNGILDRAAASWKPQNPGPDPSVTGERAGETPIAMDDQSPIKLPLPTEREEWGIQAANKREQETQFTQVPPGSVVPAPPKKG
jgi:hypothetical protein